MENLHTASNIRSFTGQYINLLDPDPEKINIVDIAHALSHQCRFGGHLKEYYSVAEHSIHCMTMAAQPHKLQALMHDASEAYLIDLPRPIKQNLPDYKVMEDKVMLAICKRFSMEYPFAKEVKEIDTKMLEKEWHLLMLREPYNGEFLPSWSTGTAKALFLSYFNQLTDGKFINK